MYLHADHMQSVFVKLEGVSVCCELPFMYYSMITPSQYSLFENICAVMSAIIYLLEYILQQIFAGNLMCCYIWLIVVHYVLP